MQQRKTDIRDKLRSRATLQQANKELLKENDVLRKKLNHKYWNSSHDVLDTLFRNGDPSLYCAAHRALREQSPDVIQTPPSHQMVEAMIERARKPLVERIKQLEQENKTLSNSSL